MAHTRRLKCVRWICFKFLQLSQWCAIRVCTPEVCTSVGRLKCQLGILLIRFSKRSTNPSPKNRVTGPTASWYPTGIRCFVTWRLYGAIGQVLVKHVFCSVLSGLWICWTGQNIELRRVGPWAQEAPRSRLMTNWVYSLLFARVNIIIAMRLGEWPSVPPRLTGRWVGGRWVWLLSLHITFLGVLIST